jgi:hypothetical protein
MKKHISNSLYVSYNLLIHPVKIHRMKQHSLINTKISSVVLLLVLIVSTYLLPSSCVYVRAVKTTDAIFVLVIVVYYTVALLALKKILFSIAKFRDQRTDFETLKCKVEKQT